MIRSLFFLCFLFLAASFWPACQDIGKVPEVVKTAFQSKYPGEKDQDWHVDRNGNYEAHFKKDGDKYRVDFSPAGDWIETERSIKKKDLPGPVKETIEREYDDAKIVELEWVDNAKKGIFYDIELKEGGQKFDVEINAEGQVIGME